MSAIARVSYRCAGLSSDLPVACGSGTNGRGKDTAMTKVLRKGFAVLLIGCAIVATLGCSDAKTLLYRSNGDIYKSYTSGKDPELLAKHGVYPAWIPGTKTHFAFVERKPGSVPMKLWVAKEDGTAPVALTKFEVHYGFSWSPDGKWLAVAHTKDGNYEIYKIKPDGSALTRLTNNAVTDQFPVWSPNGDKIAFLSARQGSQGLYLIDADGKNEKRLTPNSLELLNNLNSQPTWSGDGKKVAFVGRWGTSTDIGTVEVATGKVARITTQGGAHDPLWYDKYLFYFLHNDLYRHDMDTGVSKSLGRFIPGIPHSGLSANAAHVFFSYGKKGVNSAHIYRVQHYTADSADIGVGEWPEVW
jgi:hypothetical protein